MPALIAIVNYTFLRRLIYRSNISHHFQSVLLKSSLVISEISSSNDFRIFACGLRIPAYCDEESIFDETFSLQTRGSVPLYWSQRPNLKYKPDPLIEKSEDEKIEALRRHFDNQIYVHHYGKQVIINLLDQKGMERVLERSYAQSVQELNSSDVK